MRVVLPWRLSDEPLSGGNKHSAAEVREIANCVFQTVVVLIFLPALGFSGLAYGLGCPDDTGGTGGGRCDVAGRRFHPALWAIGAPLAVGGAVGAAVLFVVIRRDAHFFRPNDEACASFARHLRAARDAGVTVTSRRVRWGEGDDVGRCFDDGECEVRLDD